MCYKVKILSAEEQRRARLLTTMEGITSEQQQELWFLAARLNVQEAKAYAKELEKSGGTYKYSVAEVDKIVPPPKPLWRRFFD